MVLTTPPVAVEVAFLGFGYPARTPGLALLTLKISPPILFTMIHFLSVSAGERAAKMSRKPMKKNRQLPRRMRALAREGEDRVLIDLMDERAKLLKKAAHLREKLNQNRERARRWLAEHYLPDLKKKSDG